ncbi:hypothetical protein CI1B_23790 [Bradyrhizobium ivorense]|uniref:Uncharacterized protein n=1 Tax=Bradyrhizobium ivorense TaxID=2511166 RepID=A0A508T332_9BRAD|nr:hypothetical protein [Bradyrhizobium ivorense]VIO68830.1 hypothetical protein CI1B_23790 [Bradyrhizobium ivorense]
MTEKNPRYNGLYVYVFDANKLECGDVILARNAESTSFKGKAVSDAIATGSRGDFSHALLCTTPPTLIEAIDSGVSNINSHNCFIHDPEHVRVLRYPNAAIASAAASAAMMSFAKAYSKRAAISSIVPGVHLGRPRDDRTFCSALVAASFRAAGAPEFKTIDPMKTTPATLQRSARFADVTTDVLKRVLSFENIEDMSALDGDRRPSPMAGQAKLLFEYYSALLIPIDALMATYPGLLSFRPTSFFQCLDMIGALCFEVDKLPDTFEANDLRQRTGVIDELAFKLLSEGKWQAMQTAAEAIDDKSMRYTLEESFKPDPDIDLEGTLGFIRQTRDQIRSRASILNDPERPPGHSLVWDEWIRLTHLSLQYFEKRLSVLTEALGRAYPNAPSA